MTVRQNAIYPHPSDDGHEPGTLYDCPACEAFCYCGNGTPPGENPTCCNLPASAPEACHTECVHCAIVAEVALESDASLLTPQETATSMLGTDPQTWMDGIMGKARQWTRELDDRPTRTGIVEYNDGTTANLTYPEA